jgi:NTE family protein
MHFACADHQLTKKILSSLLAAGTFLSFAQSGLCAETEQSRNPPLRIGIALGGGGTRGAAHLGVLRVLEREGIKIDCVSGTSIGAVVGGLYSAGVPVDRIEQEFVNPAIMKSYLTVPIAVSIIATPLFLVPRLFGWRPYDGFYFGNKFRKYYEKCLPADRRDFEQLKIPFTAVAVDLTTCQPFPLSHGNIAQAVQASSAIPILRRPVPYGDTALLVDGAMKENLPVDQVRKLGADFVIAVPVSERIDVVPRDQFRKIGSVTRRMEQLFLSTADAQDLHHADIVIHPHTEGINILSTKSKDALKAIKAGEDAANAALPLIRKKLADVAAHRPSQNSGSEPASDVPRDSSAIEEREKN